MLVHNGKKYTVTGINVIRSKKIKNTTTCKEKLQEVNPDLSIY
jgi:hypothetical protein